MSYVARHLHTGSTCRFAAAGKTLSRQTYLAFRQHFGQDKGSACTSNIATPFSRRDRRRHSRLSRLGVRAAWGDDIEWSPARIVKTQKSAEGFHTIHLDVGAKAAKAYATAGQYLQVRLKDSKPGFYAIASSPANSQDGVFQLLIRRRGENAEQLCQAAEGTEVEASPVGGPGFRVAKTPPEDVSHIFIFATGSGIAPIKALIESDSIQAKKRKVVDLYWGTHSPEATPFQESLQGWESSGVKVNHVYSTDKLGYVQDVFEQENAFQDGSNVGVILCGHKEMFERISKQMEAAGVKSERILTNY